MRTIRKWSENNGLKNLQDMLSGQYPLYDAMAQTLNIELVQAQMGKCTYEGTPLKAHLNPRSVVQGGWAMGILDAASVLSIVSALPQGKICVTATFEAKLMRPLVPNKKCRAEGEMVYLGTNLGHAQAKLIDIETGKIIASCTCSASVFDVTD
ncbi:MAG: hypothetical protein COA69_12030 [Robiginitomaculum sp.]|nr:MAG: hypothetical protein COA69_12030 [Robiginitomaculum sp.]